MTSVQATAANEAHARGGGARGARCSGCGLVPTNVTEAADLATPWLLPGPGTAPVAGRFCRACAPPGRVEEIACARCGDGPLLARELTHLNLEVTAAIDTWLTDAGWRLVGPVCPSCLAEVAR